MRYEEDNERSMDRIRNKRLRESFEKREIMEKEEERIDEKREKKKIIERLKKIMDERKGREDMEREKFVESDLELNEEIVEE